MKKICRAVILVLAIIVICSSLSACGFLTSLGDSTNKTKTQITSMEFHSLEDEELKFHGLLGLWSDEYTGYIVVAQDNFDKDDIEIVANNSKIAEIRIGYITDSKLSYTVVPKYNGILKIYAQTKDGTVKTSEKKFVISGGTDPSYTKDEKNKVVIQEQLNVNDVETAAILKDLEDVGFDKIDSTSYGWQEDGIDTILLVCDGLVVDLGVKNGVTEYIRVYSNLGEEREDFLNLFDKSLIKRITSDEKTAYKAKQKEAKDELIREQVRSLISITKLKRITHNSSNAVDVNIAIRNNSEKTIKYVHIGFYAVNAVGDQVYCLIRGKGVRAVSFIGPIKQNETKEWTEESYWYNSSIAGMGMNYFEIEYMDGTSIVFTSQMVNALRENYNRGYR